MPAYLPPDLARLAVGLVVAQDQLGGPASSSGWKNQARLIAVKNDRTAVVQPANHGREEEVPLTALRLWLKCNHKLGEKAMARATLIDNAARLRESLTKKGGLRTIAVEEAKAWLDNGENPIVLYLLRAGQKIPAAGRVLGLKGSTVCIRPLKPGSVSVDVDITDVRIPAGIELGQGDYNALELALNEATGRLIPDKSEEPVKAVRQAVPAKVRPVPEAKPVPEPAEPAPVPQFVAPPVPVAEPVAKKERAGEWLIVDQKGRRFWAAGNDPATRWAKDIERAKIYERIGGANVAAGHLNRDADTIPEVMAAGRARFLAEQWYPTRQSEPVAEAPAPTPAPVPEPAEATPPPTPPPVPFTPRMAPAGRDAAVAKLAEAIRDRAAADAMALEAKAREVIARAEVEIAMLVTA